MVCKGKKQRRHVRKIKGKLVLINPGVKGNVVRKNVRPARSSKAYPRKGLGKITRDDESKGYASKFFDMIGGGDFSPKVDEVSDDMIREFKIADKKLRERSNRFEGFKPLIGYMDKKVKTDMALKKYVDDFKRTREDLVLLELDKQGVPLQNVNVARDQLKQLGDEDILVDAGINYWDDEKTKIKKLEDLNAELKDQRRKSFAENLGLTVLKEKVDDSENQTIVVPNLEGQELIDWMKKKGKKTR